MRRMLLITAMVAGFAGAPLIAYAQTDSSDSTSAEQSTVQEQDRHFAEKAAGANQAEIELGQMAGDKAQSSEVKDFGQMMVEDHGKAGDKLKEIAQQLNIELPSDLPQEAKDAKERLSGLSGAEFDRAYIELMVSEHEKDIDLFQKQADSGQNSELKQFAEETLPTLKQHHERARQVEEQLGTQATAGASTTGASTTGASDSGQAAVSDSPLAQMTAEDLIGKTVVNQNGEEVGEVEDIVIGGQDKVVSAVISVGGFLGIGDKHVALPVDQLTLREDEVLLMSAADEEQLESMPAYEEGAGGYEVYPPDQPLGGSKQ